MRGEELTVTAFTFFQKFIFPKWRLIRTISPGRNSQWNLDITEGQGLARSIRYNDVSLYRGSFPYILLLLGQKISFVIRRTTLVIYIHGGSLYRVSTVADRIQIH